MGTIRKFVRKASKIVVAPKPFVLWRSVTYQECLSSGQTGDFRARAKTLPSGGRSNLILTLSKQFVAHLHGNTQTAKNAPFVFGMRDEHLLFLYEKCPQLKARSKGVSFPQKRSACPKRYSFSNGTLWKRCGVYNLRGVIQSVPQQSSLPTHQWGKTFKHSPKQGFLIISPLTTMLALLVGRPHSCNI